MISGVRMTGDIGRINYVSWWIAMGRNPIAGLAAWSLLSLWEQEAWRTAAETVIDEDWVASGGRLRAGGES